MRKVVIYGERCSGTNYLENLLRINFDVEVVKNLGHKHFFGYSDLSNTEDVLFIGIVRNVEDWVNSLYRNKYHLPRHLVQNVDSFLHSEFYSIQDGGIRHPEFYYSVKYGSDVIKDYNIHTKQRYRNIFELRHVKNEFLVETMPTLVKHYCLITHDDLCNHFEEVMQKIKQCGLDSKPEFPLNTSDYKGCPHKKFVKKKNEINTDLILSNANMYYEHLLFPTRYTTA